MAEHILYHAICLIELFLLFVDYKGQKDKLTGSLQMVYIMSGLLILSDCLWGILFRCGYKEQNLLYLVNIVYFISAVYGVYAWMRYTLKTLNSVLYTNIVYRILMTVPAIAMTVLTLLSPFFKGLIFTIEDGQYIRGNLFFVDSIVKLLYLLFGCLYSLYRANGEKRRYKRKECMLLGLYCVPVIIAGLLQALYGVDFNCSAPVIGLAIVYKCGLSNEAKESSELFNAVVESYSTAFIVNIDENVFRSVSSDAYYSHLENQQGIELYDKFVSDSIRNYVVPEDRILVEKGFDAKAIWERLKNKSSYSLIYKVYKNKEEEYQKATFMKAFDTDDRREVLIGIERIETKQILLQQKQDLENEKEEFERVKESLTNVLANVIEARDVDSGEHVSRVKNYTYILANRVMEDYPKYNLTPLKIRYITNGSALHDIGKVMIPDAILLKPGRLTKEEFEIIKTHCDKGCEIIEKLPKDLDEEYTRYAREICRSHHEKYDGSGYPDGLAGDDIPIAAQIVSIVDCFDALTNKRVYKEALPPQEAWQMILDGKCGVFNKDILDCFGKSFDEICRKSEQKNIKGI